MIYTIENCMPKCICIDDEGKKIDGIVSIDTDNNTIMRDYKPLVVVGDCIATYAMKFDSVDIDFLDDCKLVSPHTLQPLPTKFTFHGLRQIES